MSRLPFRLFVSLILAAFAASPAAAQRGNQNPAAPPADVPTDLRPLLAPKHSEMRLVTNRYTADRSLLVGNFAGGGGRGGQGGGPQGGRGTAGDSTGRGGGGSAALDSAGRGGRVGGGGADSASGRGGRGNTGRGGNGRGGGGFGAGADTTPAYIYSRARFARLKRFDLDWQAALTRIDVTKLSSAAKADLDSLKGVVARNLTRTDNESAQASGLLPALPFENDLVNAIESRLRLEDIDPEKAAAMLAKVNRDLFDIRVRVEAGIADTVPAGVQPLRLSRDNAMGVAASTDVLRANLQAWFAFYNGYDPMFTWWVPREYRRVDTAMARYAALLREKVAPAGSPYALPAIAAALPPVPVMPVAPAAAPKYSSVPNLDEILALPQDEMTDIVARFVARGAGGGRGTGGAAGGSARDPKYYQSWLTALKSLDFDKLSRNAQVDYLYLKKVSELQIARDGKPLPANPPRKQDKSGIPGAARGREGLIRDLQDELIPYTPEQLIALAMKEFEWCDKEMLKASREMGFGDDWKAALEKTKTMHPPPGGQPAMIRDLIYEAIDYVRANNLVTVPEIDAESQRMSMMSVQQQLVNPFFTGGAQINVSYPTDAMDYDARLQSMRGNNRPWSHATAFHEMIPGHNLVNYSSGRYGSAYRANLGATTPFFGEGWALYWELTLYDKGFHDTPEERVGALFWRMHRCARIIFSLKFHMGEWSPQEAVDFLVDRVGHERDNATAEVRRSFQGGYGPLYQAAYLLGGLEIRGLRREVVDSKQMTEQAFHDEILRQGSMPITLLRLGLTKQKLTRDMDITWKFYGDLPEK